MPVDSSVQTVLKKDTLVAVAWWDHAAVHEVELDELCIGQVQVNCHQLTATTLSKDTEKRQYQSIRACDGCLSVCLSLHYPPKNIYKSLKHVVFTTGDITRT